jgi:ribosomal protein S18 acetylase RimI-like enzyme
MNVIQRTVSICPVYPGISLRPITEADMPFLAALYDSTRIEELRVVDWPEEQKQAFLYSQFSAQHAYYQENYQTASFDVIMLDQQPIGRIYLDRWPEEIRVVDIALLPAYRRRGIGRAFLQAIQAEAQTAGLAVRLHVEMFNPALQLYSNLGFQMIDTHGVYYLLEWHSQVIHA